MTLAWILAATVAGGVLSVVAAAVFAFNARASWVPILISYAVGALLGAVFLEILPHAFQMSDSMEQMAGTILAGILLFFVLEKLVLWRHCHVEQCEAHDPPTALHHDHGRSGMMIMIGDTFHNFVDGILIAAAFLANHELGVVTAIAIIAHEMPQEVGDFPDPAAFGLQQEPGASPQPALERGDGGRRRARLFRAADACSIGYRRCWRSPPPACSTFRWPT